MVQEKGDKRRRLSSKDRYAQIVSAAVAFFSREGFSGSTRDLARNAGITQPLIYRYFPTKQDLIRAVYSEVFVGQWNPSWEAMIRDRSLPLRDRLRSFYLDYTKVVFREEWMRIYLYSGLIGLDINRWWAEFVEERIIIIICDELRAQNHCPSVAERKPSELEMELVWSFKGTIFYYGMRREIYNSVVRTSFETYLDLAIDMLMGGAERLMNSFSDRLTGPRPSA